MASETRQLTGAHVTDRSNPRVSAAVEHLDPVTFRRAGANLEDSPARSAATRLWRQDVPVRNLAVSRRRVTVTIDRASSTVLFVRSDGVRATAPWDGEFDASSAIAMITFEAPGTSLVSFRTVQGHQIEAEVPPPHELAPVAGRPVIYLDQNHWSTLALIGSDPSSVDAAEREAGDRLIALAQRREVILPISAGHMTETCKWSNNEARYHLALTMLQLSRGWQLRDPLALRNLELREALSRAGDRPFHDAVPPFTLEPDALYSERTAQSRRDFREFPPDIAFVLEALTAVVTMFDVMLDGEPLRPAPVPGWAAHFQDLAAWLADAPRDRRHRRDRTRALFMKDLGHELLKATVQERLSAAHFDVWLHRLDEDIIARMPSLGFYRELMHEKLLNPTTTWVENDLVDMMYLSCGAAYADHVVAERRVTSDLRAAARRLGRSMSVHRRLQDLAPLLS